MNARAKRKRLVGRTIVDAQPCAFRSGRHGEWAHDWHLTLDDGTVVRFVAEETEVGEYGIDLSLSPR